MFSLVAINFHNFHDVNMLSDCLAAVYEAAHAAQSNGFKNIDVVFFNNSDKDPRDYLSKLENSEQLNIIQLEIGTNGHGLNQQIQYAMEHDYDVLFRVDSDDIVYENRFNKQLELLKSNSELDICGGGLDYHNRDKAETYLVMPTDHPSDIDFLSNQFCMHPTFAIRIASIRDKVRYWEKRIEDKRFIFDARSAGMNFQNIQAAVGQYNLGTHTRNSSYIAWLEFVLNLKWTMKFKPTYSVLAVGIFAARMVFAIDFLRRIRRNFNNHS